MIPKIIHYIWFGDQSKKPTGRINQWKEVLVGWEFREWGEREIDLDKYSYVRFAYDAKRYGICIDPFRPYILYTCGGVWLDTDVNVYKDFSDLLNCSLLVGCHYRMGVSLGVLGTEANHPIMKTSIDWYDEHWTKSTIKQGDIDSSTFAATHGLLYAPEPMFLKFIRQKYNVSSPGVTKDINTIDGVIRFQAPSILTTRLKSHPEENCAEHLYEGTWCKDVRAGIG
jgi:mannosyltransferase OCH1-like enzyme